jgi:hypothetical protein
MRIARDLHDTFLQTIQGSKLVADDALSATTDLSHMRQAMEKLSAWLGRATEEGRAVLTSLRTSTTEVNDLADAFRRHNIASVDATLPFYQDEASRMSIAKQGREELEKQFARDRERFEREHGGSGWK